jgi:hypothetical protein
MKNIRGLAAGFCIEWTNERLSKKQIQTVNGVYIETFGQTDPWYEIIKRTHEAMKYVYPKYRIIQVKEKFFGLRYYYEAEGATDMQRFILDAIVRNAEIDIEYLESKMRAEKNAF